MKKLLIFIVVLLIAGIAYAQFVDFGPTFEEPKVLRGGFEKTDVSDSDLLDTNKEILVALKIIEKQLSIMTGQELTEQDIIFY